MSRIKTAIITITAALTVLIGISSCANSGSDNTNQTNVDEQTAVATAETTTSNEDSEPEHGTSAYIDYIAAKAKEDATIATDEQLQEAVNWLKNNTTNYFSGEENMELTMYYGELLEYKYKDTGNAYEQVGWQAFKTVKYVYRGAESVLDQTTHDNLTELQDMVETLPNII